MSGNALINIGGGGGVRPKPIRLRPNVVSQRVPKTMDITNGVPSWPEKIMQPRELVELGKGNKGGPGVVRDWKFRLFTPKARQQDNGAVPVSQVSTSHHTVGGVPSLRPTKRQLAVFNRQQLPVRQHFKHGARHQKHDGRHMTRVLNQQIQRMGRNHGENTLAHHVTAGSRHNGGGARGPGSHAVPHVAQIHQRIDNHSEETLTTRPHLMEVLHGLVE